MATTRSTDIIVAAKVLIDKWDECDPGKGNSWDDCCTDIEEEVETIRECLSNLEAREV